MGRSNHCQTYFKVTKCEFFAFSREHDTSDNDHDQGKSEDEIDEYIPTGADDPFFTHDDNETKTKESNNKKKKNKRLKAREGLTEEEKEQQAREKVSSYLA